MVDALCEAALKLVYIGRQKLIQFNGRELSIVQFLSLFQKYLPVGMNEIEKEKVQHVLQVEIGIASHS